ncbi:MAG: pitrilysin family protein [Pirellulales bacterium]
MEFREHRLANGLTIVAECNADAHTTAAGFFVNTGARDETDEVAGVSHFLEHMMFKGTPSRSADDVNREFDEMGADYNAFTSEENTVYYATVLPENQGRAIGLLADIVRPSLREEDFTTEKQVIIEEIRMYADQPPFGADDKIRARHFAGHPLGRSVLGTIESVGGLSVDQMCEYFRNHYSPGNMTLVASGRVDFARLVEQAERVCGEWEPVKSDRQTPAHAAHAGFEALTKNSATQEYIMQLANGPSATDAERFAAKLLVVIVGDDSGSRLYWELVDSGLAESASMAHHGYQGTGLFMTYMSCDPENAEDNLRRVSEIFRRVEREGVSAEELATAKSKTSSRVVLSGERPRGRLFNVGLNWLNRQEYRSIQDDLDAIDGVTVEQIAAVLKKWPLSQSTTVAIGPLADMKSPN